jgi:hypothetical protein
MPLTRQGNGPAHLLAGSGLWEPWSSSALAGLGACVEPCDVSRSLRHVRLAGFPLLLLVLLLLLHLLTSLPAK